jgi:hypothetical protein
MVSRLRPIVRGGTSSSSGGPRVRTSDTSGPKRTIPVIKKALEQLKERLADRQADAFDDRHNTRGGTQSSRGTTKVSTWSK